MYIATRRTRWEAREAGFLVHTYFNQRVLQPRPRGVAKEKEMKKQKETEKKDEQSLLHE